MLQLPPSVHLASLIAGDFNTHSPSWSLPHTSPSPWAREVEDWLDTNGLQVASEPEIPTWQAVRGSPPRPVKSVIDLIILNLPAVISDEFSLVSVSFSESFGSDHAAVSIHWTPAIALPPLSPSLLPGFKLDDNCRDEWSKLFITSSLETTILDRDSTILAASSLHADILSACEPLFARRTVCDPRGARWWNRDCSAALALAKHTAATVSRRAANTGLRITIREAKRAWAQHFLDSATPDQLWQATRWRKGRRNSTLPPLRADPSEEPSADPAVQAAILRTRFFPTVPPPVPVAHDDDPPPLPIRAFAKFTEEEIRSALAGTSNRSAPGISGINYKLLKWAFESSPGRFASLFNGCIEYGIHPWGDAKVIPVPKPQRSDYSLPKAYRPISLLECCGKTLEKLIAKRVLDDSNRCNIIPPTQFGSRDAHCAVDAALAVVHTAQACQQAKRVCSLLLFDIQGFFDNIHVDRLVHLFAIFGFEPRLCNWLQSFLTERRLHFEFNGFSSEPFTLAHGTPQGSPLSPIISAIYTAPLLHLILTRWSNKSLYMYVDDGAIIASGPTFRAAADAVAQGFEDVTVWLHRNGLRIDPDKTEFITFSHPNWSERLYGPRIIHLGLRTPTGEFGVTASPFIRYLGIYIDQRLTWATHTKHVANKARSTVLALGVLGNSIRGLDFANWRKVFHAIIIPILTYGAPLWYSRSSPQKTLMNTLQVGQNDAIRKMSGVFRTTPISPLHSILNILPVPYLLKQLSSSFSKRLTRLPPSTIIRTITTHNPALPTHHPRTLIPPTFVTSLTNILPDSFPLHITPSPPYIQEWSHPRLHNHLLEENDTNMGHHIQRISSKPSPNTLSLFVYPLPHPDYPTAGFLLYSGETLVESGWRREHKLTGALFEALISGLRICLAQTRMPIFIFLPSPLSRVRLLRLQKHSLLTLSHSLVDILSNILSDSDQKITLYRITAKRAKAKPGRLHQAFSHSWPGPLGKDNPLKSLLDDAQPPILADNPTPPTPVSAKDMAFRQWHTDFLTQPHATPDSPAWRACVASEGPSFLPPFIISVLKHASRRYFTTCLQLLFRHAFIADYSNTIRSEAGDNTDCPCGSELPRPRPEFTLHHALLSCPNTAEHRASFLAFGSNPIPLLFSTEKGGAALCSYIHNTQYFLRPLPPRPDPP